MAVTLQKEKLSVNLGDVVNNSIDSVKSIRRREQARKEAEFQRAIANGLSYEEQIKMREDQLKTEKESSFSDPDYIFSLEKSVADTKKLNRFNKYRMRYAESLGELSSGKINEEEYLTTLRGLLDTTQDPELRLEIQGDVANGEKQVKAYRDTILSNQIKKAKYDGTKDALAGVIDSVKTARAQALINDNQDEVTAYDETLSALQSQISAVAIQDSITDFQVKSATRGTSPVEKLDYINSEIQKADPTTPIKIGDRTFTSVQQFWQLERDNYLSGNSQIFGNFFSELDANTKDSINTNVAKFGYPTQTILDQSMSVFNELRSKPEMTPFINRLDITQATVMSDAVEKLARRINDVGTNNLTFQEADVQLQNISTKYGIDTSGFRLQLDEQLRNLARGGVIEQDEAIKMAPDVNVELPRVDKETTTTPSSLPGVTPAAPATPAPTSGARIVKSGDTLSGIAREAGINLTQLLDLNPQFKTNPNIIRPGQSINLPGQVSTTPSAAPVIKPAAPETTAAPAPKPPVAAPTAPAPTTTPATPTPSTYTVKSGDTLSGIALKLLGDASRFKEIAEFNNIADPNKIASGATINIPL